MRINLRHYYPDFTEDVFVDISDEIVIQLISWEHEEQALQRRIYRYRAYYSLDRDDGIEKEVKEHLQSPEGLYEIGVVRDQLRHALSTLPEKQANRIIAYYINGMSMVEIAKEEGVTKAAVTISIQRGMKVLRQTLQEIFSGGV